MAVAEIDPMTTGIGALPMDAANDDFDYQNSGGIGSNMVLFAEKLAEKGRGADTVIGHLTPGEIVVPTDILEQNPEVKELIFAEMRLAGIEDPQRYIVGAEANSINPETGQPEFLSIGGWNPIKTFKQTVSSVGKGLSSAVKTVGNVLKKVAPVVLPVALSFVPVLGPMYGAALGSGIATLINGGSLKDAIKAGAISGAMGGLTAGIGSKIQGGTFMGGLKSAADPARFSAIGSRLGAGDYQGFFKGDFTSAYADTPAAIAARNAAQSSAISDATTGTTVGDVKAQATDITGTSTNVPRYEATAVDPGANLKLNDSGILVDAPTGVIPEGTRFGPGYEGYVDTSASGFGRGASSGLRGSVGPDAALTLDASGNLVPTPTAAPAQINYATQSATGLPSPVDQATADALTQNAVANPPRTFFQKAGDYMFSGGNSPADIANMRANAYATELATTGDVVLAREAARAAGPGVLASYGPSLALAGGAAYLGGMFDVPEQPEPDLGGAEEQFEGTRYFEMTPEQREAFRIQGLDPRAYQGRESYTVGYDQMNPYLAQSYSPYKPMQTYNPYDVYQRYYGQDTMYAANGGEAQNFPRRNGYISGPGTETSDDVPAMLSDGEFVMTARAVRGAGNGSRQQGVRNMMNMMKNFEMRAA